MASCPLCNPVTLPAADTKADLDDLVKTKIVCPCQEPNQFLGCSSRSLITTLTELTRVRVPYDSLDKQCTYP